MPSLPPLLLCNATLIDGTGAAPVPSAAILIDDGKISWAGPEHDLPTSAGAGPTRALARTTAPIFKSSDCLFGSVG